MPHYDYRCRKGHTFSLILPVSKHTDHMGCKTKGCRCVAEQFLSRPPHPHSGKLFWTGEEVYGKKLLTDEHRADVEAEMVEGALSHDEMTREAFS